MKKTALMISAAFAFTLMLGGIAACNQKEEPKPVASAQPAAVSWHGFDDGMAKAKSENRYILVDFYTSWCKYCKMLDENTFANAEVAKRLNTDFVAVKVNAEGDGKVTLDGEDMTEQQLAAKLQVTGYPTLWFFNPKGEKLKFLPGYSPPEDFVHILDYVSSGGMERNEDFGKFLEERGVSVE